MNNPWKDIDLNDYESHMSLDSVKQLQAMNKMMKEQFFSYDIRSLMILGIAGGNGLEQISKGQFEAVYGVDINEDYLAAVKERYPELECDLKLLCVDLINESDRLPHADLVIANLLVEYIGYEAFADVISKVQPDYVSCIIQINTDENAWVSDSPYLHAFDALDQVHHQMEECALCDELSKVGYERISIKEEPLPNGKKLVRIDLKKI